MPPNARRAAALQDGAPARTTDGPPPRHSASARQQASARQPASECRSTPTCRPASACPGLQRFPMDTVYEQACNNSQTKRGSLRAAHISSVVSIQARSDKNSPRDDGHAENRGGTRRGACGTQHLVPHKNLHAMPGTTQVLPCGAECRTYAFMRRRGTTQTLSRCTRCHTSTPVRCRGTTFKFRAAVFYHTKNSCGTSASTIDGINYLNLHFCR